MPLVMVGKVKSVEDRQSNGKTYYKAVVVTGDDKFQVDARPGEYQTGDEVILEGTVLPPAFEGGVKRFQVDVRHDLSSVARIFGLKAAPAQPAPSVAGNGR